MNPISCPLNDLEIYINKNLYQLVILEDKYISMGVYLNEKRIDPVYCSQNDIEIYFNVI